VVVKLLTVGDNVVDRYPERELFYPGGNAVNVAVHARRLGARSSYIGAVGTDRAGDVVLGSLRDEGVDTTRTRVVEGPNAHAVVHIVDGNRVFAKGDLGVSVFELDHEDFAAAASVDVVHTGECSYVEDQVPELARCAKQLSFDFSERQWSYIVSLAPYVDIAIRSAPAADRRAALDEARRLHELGPRTVAVTLGAGGAVIVQDGASQWAPAPSGGPIVDTLGAGDAFIARLLVGLARGEPIAEVAGAATAYATVSCSRFGAFGHATALDPNASPTQAQQRPDRLDVS
jgi:fructoselysine 6-kinase